MGVARRPDIQTSVSFPTACDASAVVINACGARTVESADAKSQPPLVSQPKFLLPPHSARG